MDIFWLYVAILAAAVVILVGVPYNCIKANGTVRKAAFIGNGVMLGVIAFTLLFMLADHLIRLPYEREYSKASGGFFNTFHYGDTIEGYHTFLYTKFLVEEAEIAIPAEKCNIPILAPVYPDVVVYYNEQSPLYNADNIISIENSNYYVSESAAAIFTDYTGIEIIIFLSDIPLLVLFNVICFFIVRKRKRR